LGDDRLGGFAGGTKKRGKGDERPLAELLGLPRKKKRDGARVGNGRRTLFEMKYAVGGGGGGGGGVV